MGGEVYGRLPDGRTARLLTLSAGGVEVDATNYGGIITSVRVPDRAGNVGDIVLGLDSLDDYLRPHPYFGAIVGRYANRIAGGRFSLDGVEYRLARNDGANSLHGGIIGFDKVLWEAKATEDQLVLSYLSRDGEEGYPGNLRAKVTYILSKKGELRLIYEAETDAPTVLNLTNHSYFNLACKGDVLGHELTLDAESFTPAGAGLIPTGEISSVAGTPMDFRRPTRIGAHIDSKYDQLTLGGGYDCNWVVDGEAGRMRKAAIVRDPSSGRCIEVRTTQPGIQFYTGNFLDGTLRGKGRVYARRSGLCLETQHYPDSPNKPSFPSTMLQPGEWCREETVFRFYAE